VSRPLRSYVDSTTICPDHPQLASAYVCAIQRVSIYLEHYSGALFDPDPNHQPWFEPNVLKVSDVSCVGHLSMWSMVDAYASQVATVFETDLNSSRACPTATTTCVQHLHCILQRLPDDSDIFTAPPTWIAECSDFFALCRALDLRSTRPNAAGRFNRWGDAAVSKLLARKRPALVPVMDSVAGDRYPSAVGIRAKWAAFHSEVYGDTVLTAALAGIHAAACGSTPWITPLRLLDIIVWMHESPSGR